METKDKTNIERESYLSFQIGSVFFAIHVSHVESISELLEITKLPKMPPFLKGIIDLRGNPVPVIDTKFKLGWGETDVRQGSSNLLILETPVESENVIIAALVDSVNEVLEIAENEILPPPGIGGKYKSNFIKGMVKHNSEFIMLLNLDLLFEIDELEMVADLSVL